MKARIRDFFENQDGWIFAVADYLHPDGIRSLLRYVPDPEGERESRGIRYRKMDFQASYEFLRGRRPEYIRDLHVVPFEDVARIYRPPEGLASSEDPRVRRIAALLASSGVPWGEMGITGSMLVGLQDRGSDIDFVVYGNWWWRARDAVERAKRSGEIGDLDEETWRRIYAKRRPETCFDEFLLHEVRKGNRGMVDGTYFDLLFTRAWGQIQEHPSGRVVGRGRVVARVLDATFSFDSPAIYLLDHRDVREIFCYSHTYAGQALPGEVVEAEGLLEETPVGLRLVVGTTREARGEWIRSLTLMEG